MVRDGGLEKQVQLRAFVSERDFGRRGLCAGDYEDLHLDSSGSDPTNSISCWIVVCLPSARVERRMVP